MKLFTTIMITILTMPTYAQSILGSLEKYQKEIQPSASTTNTPGEIKVDPVVKTKSTGACTEKVQTSLPLAYITAMIMEKDGALEIKHDSRSGKLTVKTPDMIGNCSSMIEWVPNARSIDGKKVYSIEAKIKNGEECAEGVCTYDVAKVENGQFKDFEKIKMAPTMQGFESCLEKSGVVKDGKVVPSSIYPSAVSEKFDGYKESGEVLFVSHGPSSKLVKPKYDKNFVEINECDHFERITAEGIVLKSLEQEEQEFILSEKEKVRNCGEYDKISDFIEKYQGYSDDLNGIRDHLIIEAVKKAAKAVTDGNYTEEDLKTIADFEKYVIQPKVDLASLLYTEAEGLEGEERSIRIAEMKKILAEVGTYNNAPFISAALVKKLESDGRFNEAAQANGSKAIIVAHSRLGAKDNGVIVTPEIARLQTQKYKIAYANELERKKEQYEVRTGQTTGQSQAYAQMASRMRQNIQVRSQNFSQEINEEYARTQPGGYCYKNPFRNVQRCIQKSMIRVQELQAQMQHFNKVDAERAVEFDQKAAEYGKLEQEGREYVARQNGDPVPSRDQPTDNMSPTPRNEEGYAFNFQGNPQMQQQQMYQQNMNPYQQQGMFTQQQYSNPYMQQQYNSYQQPNYMGQQNFSGQFNVGANYGMNSGMGQYGYNGQQGQQQQYGNPYMQQGQQQQYGNPYMQQGQQQGQQGYWSNPYQAYGSYSMYGG